VVFAANALTYLPLLFFSPFYFILAAGLAYGATRPKRAHAKTRRVFHQRAIIVRKGLLAYNGPRLVADRRLSVSESKGHEKNDSGWLLWGRYPIIYYPSPCGRGAGVRETARFLPTPPLTLALSRRERGLNFMKDSA